MTSSAPYGGELDTAAIFLWEFSIALGTMAAFYNKEAGHLLVQLGQRLSGDSYKGDSRPDLPPMTEGGPPRPTAPTYLSGADLGSTPADASQPPSASQGNSDRPDPNVRATSRENQIRFLAVETPAARRQPSSHPSAPKTPTAENADGGEAELALALEYLRTAGRGNRSAAAQMLWLAVEKGSTQAEIELADLYLRGEGVPRSCEQARILLSAAYSNNNAAAGQRLAQLDNAACR